MCSNPSYNYPAQPSYGEGMADAMKAQMQMLTGTGDDFSKIYEEALGRKGGSLQDILREFEAPIRRETAQIDTDVLRQTILGGEQKVVRDPETGKYGIPTSTPVPQEALPEGQSTQTAGGRYQIVLSKPSEQRQGRHQSQWTLPQYSIIDTKTGGLLNVPEQSTTGKSGANLKLVTSRFNELNDDVISAAKEGIPEEEVKLEFEFTNPNTGKPLQEGEVVREGTGMVDLLGDTRTLQEGRRLTRDEQGEGLISNNPELEKGYSDAQNDPSNPYHGLSRAQAGRKLLEDYGGDLDEMAKDFGVSDIVTSDYGTFDTGRQAGFDESGNFLGLAALAEDVQRGHLTRQRTQDLMDVALLSDQYQDIMEDYKPGTQEALDSARKVLEQRKTDLTGGAITVPTGSTYGGDVDAITAAAAPTLSADTAFGGELAAAGTDPLRQRLLAEAKAGLGEGLTAREKQNLEQFTAAAAERRGRPRDLQAIYAESEAKMLEDRNRQAMNRAFAQQVLGQEAGLQTGDLGRGMQQEGMQADITQRRDLTQFGADVDRARMEQAQGQQAGQFDVGAKMDAERIGEQLKQSGTLGYIDAATRLAALEDQHTLDPFQAVLGRGGGGSLGAGQSLFGQAGYGLQSGPQYLNPEAGLGYISNMAANQASMYGAGQMADASRSAGMMGMFGNIGRGVAGIFG